MSAIEDSMQEYLTRRAEEIEYRATHGSIRGDFEGTVRGSWQGLDSTGTSFVSYRGRTYPVVSIGFTTLWKNAPVELTFSNGIYYASS